MCVVSNHRRSIICSTLVLAAGVGIYFVNRPQPSAFPRILAAEDATEIVAAQEAKKEESFKPGTSDHSMFGGTPSRNMVNLVDKNIPSDFDKDSDLLWKVQLGDRAYGGPTVALGRVLVGTNNQEPRNNRDRNKPDMDNPMGSPIDKGILMCFEDKGGKFLWQAVHDKHPAGQVHDWPHEGICSTPTVEGDRVYYVSNRCTVVCADLNGFANGNDGFQKEKYQSPTDVDIIWEYDMMESLKVFPHNMSASSPLIIGDILFVVTANGVDEGHINLPSPEAPSFLALNKKTGKVIWKDASPGRRIMHGQWSNAAHGTIKGVPQIIFPGGDGWLYSFKPDTGELLWKFDANPKDSKYELGSKCTRSDFIGTPVIYDDRVYIGTGQDPEHGTGIAHFWCIDPAGKSGDISPTLVTDAKTTPPATKANPNSGAFWHFGGEEKRPFHRRDYVFGRTMSSACIVDDIVYISELDGYLHCLDAKTGKKFWQYDTKGEIWGSAYYVDGKIFLANSDGDLYVFKHVKNPETLDEVEMASKAKDEAEAKKIRIDVAKQVDKKYKLGKIEIGNAIRSTPVVANGIIYVMTENTLYAFKKKN